MLFIWSLGKSVLSPKREITTKPLLPLNHGAHCTTFSGQLTRGALSCTSAAGGRGGAGDACTGFGLSFTAEAAGATVQMAGAIAAGTAEVAVVELGALSLLEASPSPSLRLPTAGCGALLLLMLRSSAPSGLERVRGLGSAGRSSPSAWPGSDVSMSPEFLQYRRI